MMKNVTSARISKLMPLRGVNQLWFAPQSGGNRSRIFTDGSQNLLQLRRSINPNDDAIDMRVPGCKTDARLQWR